MYIPLKIEMGLTVDSVVESGAYIRAIAQNELDRIRQKATAIILRINEPPNFDLQVGKGQFEKPLAKATLKIIFADHTLAEHFVVMKNMTGLIIGLHFTKHNSVFIDTTQGFNRLPHMTMQFESAASQTSDKPQAVLIHDSLTIPPRTMKTIKPFVDHKPEWNTTGIVTPLGKITEAASLLVSHSMSKFSDNKIAVRVRKTTEPPYSIRKSTQIAEFSVVIPEQSNFIKPMDTAILSMIPEGDLSLATYFNELLRTKKPDQQDNTIWFPIPEIPGKNEDHTPIQTRILKKLYKLKEKEKLNPKDDTETRMKIPKQVTKSDTLILESEQQALKDLLDEYHDIFAKNRLDISKNTEFKLKLTPIDGKTVYSQNLPAPFYLKADHNVQLALINKYGTIIVLHFSNYASPIFPQREANGKLRLLAGLRKINTLTADVYTNNYHQVSTLSDAAHYLAEKSLFYELYRSLAYHCLQMIATIIRWR